ncbi:MAG: alcohol dehydrogenase catalytic domain-containing protein, partial [bacterium]|nr:alcohol dehydrogenase catalytic domain-containing protein [bacterium]
MTARPWPMPERNPEDALLRVKYTGICGTDAHIFQGHMDQRVSMPLPIGHEMSAEVVEAPNECGFAAGDRVVVEPTVGCNDCPACRMGCQHICHRLKFLGID